MIPPLKGIRSSQAKQRITQVSVQRSRAMQNNSIGRLSNLLADVDVSGSSLWKFVRMYIVTSDSRNDRPFTAKQRAILHQVLQKALDEWNRERFDLEVVESLPVIRFYARQNLFSRKDWAYYLSFLARTAYLNVKSPKDQHAEHGLDERINDTIRLGLLCETWKLFLLEDAPESCGNTTSTKENDNLWPGLRDKLAQGQYAEYKADYVENFASLIARENETTDPDLDRHLSYTSVLTLVALYSSMMTFAVDSIDAPSATGTYSQTQVPTHEGESASIVHPNWHLGSGQSNYWTPEIGHLSVSEASMLYLFARAARGATLNLTLLRLELAQFSLPDSDAQEIARIYQGFTLAVPVIFTKFQSYTYDELVYQRGPLRRYPFRAYVQKAIASNNIEGLEYAAAIAEIRKGPEETRFLGDLALVKAFLQLDDPLSALRYWNVLARRVKPDVNAWQVWLDYAFQEQDDVAYSIVWNKLRTIGISRSSEMWFQRLFLLHRINQPSVAWSSFCNLLRYSGQNKQLLGMHIPSIAPSAIDIELFHMMIQAYLERKDGYKANAKEVLQLLKKQEGLQATRKTYMLFVEDSLRIGACDLATQWFGEGKSLQIRFLPEDYAHIFEYHLNRHGEGPSSPLSDFRSNVLRCFEAISRLMRLVRGARLFTRSSYQVEISSSNIESILKTMPLEDDVDDDLKDPILKETQSLYTALIKSLAQNFAERPSDSSKTARLRLILLLWDHCIATGIPASTEMESVLRFIIYGMHPDLQQKLMTGLLFRDYDPEDTVSLHCYRSLRYIGRQWFAERISSIAPGLDKSQLERLPWNGYDAVTEETLMDVGMSSQEDRQKVLNEIKSWKNVAIRKREKSADKKKEKQREKRREVSRRLLESTGEAKKSDDLVSDMELEVKQQSEQIAIREQKISKLLQDRRTPHDNERRLVFETLCSDASSDSTENGSESLFMQSSTEQPVSPMSTSISTPTLATEMPYRRVRSRGAPYRRVLPVKVSPRKVQSSRWPLVLKACESDG